MKSRTTIATLALLAAKQAVTSSAQQQLQQSAQQENTNSHMSDLDDLSLEELLGLRESILEAKLNLTYYIEESDDDDDDEDDDDDNSASDDDSDDDEEQNDAVAKHVADVESHLQGKLEEVSDHDEKV